MKNLKILVTGATGMTGGHAISTLKASGHEVRAFAHGNNGGAEALRASGVEVVTGDLLDIDSIRAALKDVRAAYYVYPLLPQNLAGTANFAQAAKEAGVSAIVNMSQITARPDSVSHISRDHWLAEQVLNWSGVPVTHLRPTLFAEWMLYPFSWQDYARKDTLALPFGTGRLAPIASADQGRVIAAILANPAPHAGRMYQLVGPVELDGYGIAAAMSGILGRTIRYTPLEMDDFSRSLRRLPAYSSEFIAQHFGSVAMDVKNGITGGVNSNVEDLTGRAPMSVQQFVATHRPAFEPSSVCLFLGVGWERSQPPPNQNESHSSRLTTRDGKNAFCIRKQSMDLKEPPCQLFHKVDLVSFLQSVAFRCP